MKKVWERIPAPLHPWGGSCPGSSFPDTLLWRLQVAKPWCQCAKLHTVAASKSRDYTPRSRYYRLIPPFTYWCCSTCISHSWWI